MSSRLSEVSNGGNEMRYCNACDWKGPTSKTVHPKHWPEEKLCPVCNETTGIGLKRKVEAEELSNDHLTSMISSLEALNDQGTVIAALRELLSRRKNEEWIRVGDRLPETDDRILAWNNSTKEMEPATFDGARFIDESGYKVDLTEVVTHWRPLPARVAMAKCPHGCDISGPQCIPDDHLHDDTMEFYVACDCCDFLMNKETPYFYDQATGETLCNACEPK